MKLPSRIIDLSSPLENETVYDPPFMRPKIAYRSNVETAPFPAFPTDLQAQLMALMTRAQGTSQIEIGRWGRIE